MEACKKDKLCWRAENHSGKCELMGTEPKDMPRNTHILISRECAEYCMSFIEASNALHSYQVGLKEIAELTEALKRGE